MSATDGPFGPGLRRGDEAENRSRYFRSTKALWNLNNVAGVDERAAFPDSARTQEQRGQPEDQAIEGGQIRRPTSRTIADQQLMFEQQRFCGDGACATWAQQLREGGEQVGGEDQKFAHKRTLA